MLPEEEREDRAKAGGKYRPPDGVVRCAVEAGALHRVRALYIQIIALKLREAVDVEFEVDDAKDEANDREYRRQRIEEEPILEDTLVSLLIFQQPLTLLLEVELSDSLGVIDFLVWL